MQVQPINNSNSQTFGALNLTSAAKTLIEQEKGGKAAIKQFTKELENSKWDLNIKTIGNDAIYPYFGKDRATCVIPSYVQDEYVMVYSSNAHSMDNEDDIVDCLKFPSKQRAKEVYDTYPRFCGIKFFKHIFHTSIYRSKVIKLEVYLWEMCQKVSNKNVIIQSENITFFHFIITFMITFLNYIELIFIQKCNRYF